jgi:hypothetical protein
VACRSRFGEGQYDGRRNQLAESAVATGFADKLVEGITDEAPMHRLW